MWGRSNLIQTHIYENWFVSKLRTTLKVRILVCFFHINFFLSYILRHKQSHYTEQRTCSVSEIIVGLYRDREPCSSSVSFCSISSNIRVFHSQKKWLCSSTFRERFCPSNLSNITAHKEVFQNTIRESHIHSKPHRIHRFSAKLIEATILIIHWPGDNSSR